MGMNKKVIEVGKVTFSPIDPTYHFPFHFSIAYIHRYLTYSSSEYYYVYLLLCKFHFFIFILFYLDLSAHRDRPTILELTIKAKP